MFAMSMSCFHYKKEFLVLKRIINVLSLSFLLLFFVFFAEQAPLSAFASSAPPRIAASAHGVNPASPAYGHSYRHGVVPTIPQLGKMKAYQAAHPAATDVNTLTYGGGIDGIGVTSGKPQVYLVFWGNQWGTQSTNSQGDLTFSGDSAGAAPYVQELFKGLGTGSEGWSGTMTQYCDGPSVAAGATSCSSSDLHVAYPSDSVLAGVWSDNADVEPDPASGNQLATEAITAAAHFGNTTAASNRYAQYVILSASGLDPDNWLSGGFCAWHDYNGDAGLSGGAASSPYGDIAFTNLPYVLDQGSNCGQSFVNGGSAGHLDGFSIVEGHEYAETLTDQNPAGGWTNPSSGEENGDECAWISSGQGASADVTMGNGSYAMQSTWSNDTNECDISHAIFGRAGGLSITINPTSLAINPGASGTATISTAVTGGSARTVSLSASVSPPGPTVSLSPTSVTAGGSSTLTINVGTGIAVGGYTVTVMGTEGSATASATTVALVGATGNLGITNGGFETGDFSGWTTSGTTSISTEAIFGKYTALLGSPTPTKTDSTISQTFTVPNGDTRLTFWFQTNCASTVIADWTTVTLKDNTTGTTSVVSGKICGNYAWTQGETPVTVGHSYTVTMLNHDSGGSVYPPDAGTYTYYDDVSLS